ncbi:MAG: GNAT family N-acetyltransferase [Pseudomonadota bacterium]
MKLRRALEGDAEACVDILRAWIEETPWMPLLHSRGSMLSFWRDRLANVEGYVCESDRITGFAVRDGKYVTALFVASDARRMGIGSRLLEAVADKRDTHLWTFQANETARAFYRANGFQELSRTSGDNEEKLADVLLFRPRSA